MNMTPKQREAYDDANAMETRAYILRRGCADVLSRFGTSILEVQQVYAALKEADDLDASAEKRRSYKPSNCKPGKRRSKVAKVAA